jgi:diaminopimelate decarboxylase
MSWTDKSLSAMHRDMGGSFFAYDLDSMAKHLSTLQSDGVRLWYACKANPLSAVLQTIDQAGFSFDVASLGELKQVLAQRVKGEKILLTGPGKSDAFLRHAFLHQVKTFVVESPTQLQRVQSLADEYKTSVDILLRLQLDWPGGGSSVLGGAKLSVFGQALSEWGELPRAANLNYRGIHVFQWGNILSVEQLTQIWLKIAEEAQLFARTNNFSLDILDLGGGLGISYKDSSRLEWSDLKPALEQARLKSGAKEIWLELGRYAVGPFGTYVTEILERKSIKGQNFLVCAGGSQHILRPALVSESFPARILNKSGATDNFSVHGPLCTALDYLGHLSLPQDCAAGDLIAFTQCGAYGFTESMPYFLCHDLAGEVVLKNSTTKVLRPVVSAETWLR